MPRLQYISGGGVAGATPYRTSGAPGPGLDLRVAAGVAGQVADSYAQLQEVQRREAAKIKADETRMRVSNTLSEAQASWMERFATAQQSAPADAAGFTETLLKDFDAFAEERGKQIEDGEGRRMLDDGLRRLRLGLHADAFNFEIKQRNAALVSSFSEGLDADRRSVTANPAAFQETLARRLATAETINVPANVRAKLAEDAKRTLAADAANALVDQNPAGFLERAGMRSAKGAKGKTGDRAEDAAARVASDPLLSSLDPQDMRRVLDRASMLVTQQEAAAAAEAERRARLAEIEANRRARAADQAWNILSSRTMAGVATDPVGDRALLKAIEGTPYAAEYRRLAAEIPKRQAFGMLPPAQMQAQIDALIAQRNERGTSKALEDQLAMLREIKGAADKAYADSPLRASQMYGLQNVAPIDTSSLPALVQTIGVRAPQATLAGQQVGRGASPLLPEEVPAVARAFATLNPDQKGQFIAQLAQRVPGDQLQAMAKQLDGHDRPLALAMAAGAGMTTQGRTTAELVLRGAQAVKDKAIKIEGGAEFGLKAQIAAAVGDAIPGATRKDVIDAAVLISVAKQAEGNSISTTGAVNLAIGGSIVEHNGRRVPVPVGVDETGLKTRMQTYPQAEVAAQSDDGWVYLPGGRKMGVPEFLAALPDAQLEPVGMGRFAVRSGGSLVLGKNRRPVVVTAR